MEMDGDVLAGEDKRAPGAPGVRGIRPFVFIVLSDTSGCWELVGALHFDRRKGFE